MKNKRSNFEVGDKVWTIDNGWGEVIEMKDGIAYPVSVEFEKSKVSYTKDGREFESKNVVLFFEEIPIPESALVRPKWRAEMHEPYYFINSRGDVCRTLDERTTFDCVVYKAGNYFQTRKEAKDSKFYKVFHDIGEKNV